MRLYQGEKGKKEIENKLIECATTAQVSCHFMFEEELKRERERKKKKKKMKVNEPGRPKLA